MKEVHVGKSFYASSIALGCMRISGKTVKEAEKLIGTAIDCGIDYFDHADIYGDGESETLFGKVLKNNPSWRASIKIQTKCGIVRGKMYDFSRAHILEAVEGSLSRLCIAQADALLLHRPDALYEPDEIAGTFDKLFQDGKVRCFGVSNFNAMQIALLKQSVKQPIVANQLQFGVAHTGMIDSGMCVNTRLDGAIDRDGNVLDYCRLHGITVQPWSPFAYGFFDGIAVGSDKYPALNEALAEVGGAHGISPSAAAIAWILRHPAKMQPIIGTTNPARVQEIAKAADATLTREEWYRIYLAAGNKLP